MKTYVILGFDMETDIGSYTKSYNGVMYGTKKIIDILTEFGATATFFFTGDAAEKHPEAIRDVRAAGHEVGCHSLKHETVGESAFNMPNDTPILESEVSHRLALNKELVKRSAGIDPVSFRAPRLWQGHAQILALEQQGFSVDASYSVSRHRIRVAPYHPSETNWKEAGSMKLLEIPNFAFLNSSADYSRFFGADDQWPLLRLLGADFVSEHCRPFLDLQQAECGVGVLLYYLHPWEFVPMPDHHDYDEGTLYFRPELHENCGDKMAQSFRQLLGEIERQNWQIVTCKDFYRHWEALEDRVQPAV